MPRDAKVSFVNLSFLSEYIFACFLYIYVDDYLQALKKYGMAVQTLFCCLLVQILYFVSACWRKTQKSWIYM